MFYSFLVLKSELFLKMEKMAGKAGIVKKVWLWVDSRPKGRAAIARESAQCVSPTMLVSQWLFNKSYHILPHICHFPCLRHIKWVQKLCSVFYWLWSEVHCFEIDPCMKCSLSVIVFIEWNMLLGKIEIKIQGLTLKAQEEYTSYIKAICCCLAVT